MKKILLIEDDKIISNIYSNKFRIEGFQIEVAEDGESGLERARESVPDLIVVDIMLPKMNGIEVIKQIRSRPETRLIPIVVFSNSYLSSLVQDAWKAGANHCLIKASCTPKQLIEVVHKALARENALPLPPDAMGPDPVAPPPTRDPDSKFEAELRHTFLREAPQLIQQLRPLLQAFGKSESDVARMSYLLELYKKAHSLASGAGITGIDDLVKISTALEAFVKELYDKPKNITASTTRTLAATIDFLTMLFERSQRQHPESLAPVKSLVVDDEVLSRRAVVHALDKAGLASVAVADAEMGLSLLKTNSFDLIITDVDMPGMNGFEFCKELRKFPEHNATPVIFVTGLSDFENRAQSTLSGGNDLIAKPFVFAELGVRALIHLLQRRLKAAGPPPPS